MSQEKRSNERHHVRFKLVYDDGETFNAGTVMDVSEGGLFLETALALPVGTIVSLTPLDPTEDVLFEVKARVVRVVPYDDNSMSAPGMGLKLLDLDAEARKDVVRMILSLEDQLQGSTEDREMDPYLGVMVPSQLPTPSS